MPQLPPSNSVGLDSAGYHIDTNGNKLNSEGNAIDSAGYLLEADGKRKKHDHDSDTETPEVDQRAPVGERSFVKVSDKYRYYRNEERVRIAVTNATIEKVGSYDIASSATIEMSELEGIRTGTADTDEFISGSPKLSGSHTLTLSASDAEEVTVTITDQTPAADSSSPSAPYEKTRVTYVFTVYVVHLDSDVNTPAFDFNDGTLIDTTTEATARSDQRDLPIDFDVTGSDPTNHIPLEFKVEGGGQVYVWKSTTRTGRPSSTLSTSSEATVYLDMRGNTNKVTAWVSGTNPAVTGKSIIYIHGYAQLEITEGDGQTGAPGGRLEGPLGVKVTDSRNRPIRYPLIVSFPATSTDSNGSFIPFPGTTLLVSNEKTLATATAPDTATAHEVYTDSSSVVKIYYQLNDGLTAGESFNIMPGLKHNTAVTTRFTFNTGTTGSATVANLEILSGNPQSAAKGENVAKPLVVIARSAAEYRIPNVVIQFRTNTGILTREGLTGPPVPNDDATLRMGRDTRKHTEPLQRSTNICDNRV